MKLAEVLLNPIIYFGLMLAFCVFFLDSSNKTFTEKLSTLIGAVGGLVLLMPMAFLAIYVAYNIFEYRFYVAAAIAVLVSVVSVVRGKQIDRQAILSGVICAALFLVAVYLIEIIHAALTAGGVSEYDCHRYSC